MTDPLPRSKARPFFVHSEEAPGAATLAAFDETLRLRGLAGTTREEYVRTLKKLAVFARRDPAELGEADARAFLVHLYSNHNYAPTTHRVVLGAVRLFYRTHLGRDWRLLAVARAPRLRAAPRGLTREQVRRLFAEVGEPRFRTLLRLVYACGLRIGEALALTVADIEREGPSVRVRHGKGNRARSVPLPPAMLAELRAWWRLHRNPRWLFPAVRGGREGRAMSASTVQMRLQRARAAARLPAHATPHALRHSYATHMLEEGVCIRVISACLGHSLLQTTLLYARVTTASEARAREAAGRLMAGEDGWEEVEGG